MNVDVLASSGLRAQVADLDREIDSVKRAIIYEASQPEVDHDQLAYLYARIDVKMTHRHGVNRICQRVLDGEITDAYELNLEIGRVLDLDRYPTHSIQLYFQRLGAAIRRIVGEFQRFAAKVFTSLGEAAKQAWGALRKLFRPSRKRSKRPKGPSLPLPLEPRALAREQAPGATSGVIRGEVRYMRRFL